MDSKIYRTEYDSLGAVEVPMGALYGPQTQRAVHNFTISAEPMPWEFISAVILIKLAAAHSNGALDLLTHDHRQAIEKSCAALLQGKHIDQFPVSVFQTGSGTSTNMNVNEVISSLAAEEGVKISPNDHINLGQSSNDVIPSAIHISTALALKTSLLPALHDLSIAIRESGENHKTVVKTGRTHLMDALPIRLQAEFNGWSCQIDECSERLTDSLKRLARLPLGGTAVGSGVNCHPEFAHRTISYLGKTTGIDFTPALSPYKGLSSIDTALEISGHLKNSGMVLFKIANDLRWMNSGPGSGLGEITLPALQPGSSIMPAKVNPVIPEAVCMAAAQVAGYDSAVTLASQAGNFQLNTMLPLTGFNLLQMIHLLTGSCRSLQEKVFGDLKVNHERCLEPLHKNPILVTALAPEIGYMQAAEIGKIAARERRPVLDVAKQYTNLSEERLHTLLDPRNLADGGRQNV